MKNLVFVLTIMLLTTTIFAQGQSDQVKQGKMKPALIVIDTQNQFMPYIDDRDTRLGFEMINWAIITFRSYGFPVIRVYHTDLQNGPSPDSEAFQYPEKLQVRDTDPMVIKNYANSFKKTNLDKIIKELGANTLFLCGLSSVGCVISTYHGAKDYDYDVILIEDALMSHDASQTESIERIFDSVNLTVMEMMLKYAKAE